MLQLHDLAESAVCIVPSPASYGYGMIMRAISTNNEHFTQAMRDRQANELCQVLSGKLDRHITACGSFELSAAMAGPSG
jgi:hypothetical protein